MQADNTVLVILDVQDRLLNNIFNQDLILRNIKKMIEASHILGIQVLSTEQNPLKLGNTIKDVRINLKTKPCEKFSFSCTECKSIMEIITNEAIKNVMLCGVESHICIQQSAIKLQRYGLNVFVSIDAIGSRKSLDHDIAIKRLISNGITVTSTESAIFEWCNTSDRREFKQISTLIKE